jgi:sterol desaturase/sphingolipid hydroxylase (fatty acid hydroxylase superfamily)
MDAVIAYFTTIPSSHRALILAGGIAFFWLWESAAPLVRFRYAKWSHALVNVFFTATTIVVNFALAFLLLRTSEWAVAHQVGALFLLADLPVAVQALAGLLLLDLVGAWLPHFVEHHVPVLWRLHLVHHSDQAVDTTTANRHHPGESVVRFAFTALAVVVAGAPMWLVFLYQSVSVVPLKRNGDAPTPSLSSSGAAAVFTPAELLAMPVCTGKRPDNTLAWPGAVSVIA